MNIYDEIENLLEPIDLTLDMMKKLIQPTIFDGLKSNIESIKHIVKRHEERAKKVEELLDLYRLQQEFKERYITEVRPLDRQKTLDDIREITEEIYLKEEELEEMN